MLHFDFNNPTHLLFGSGKLNDLHAQAMPGQKALLLISTGKSTRETGSLARAGEQLALPGLTTRSVRKSMKTRPGNASWKQLPLPGSRDATSLWRWEAARCWMRPSPWRPWLPPRCSVGLGARRHGQGPAADACCWGGRMTMGGCHVPVRGRRRSHGGGRIKGSCASM